MGKAEKARKRPSRGVEAAAANTAPNREPPEETEIAKIHLNLFGSYYRAVMEPVQPTGFFTNKFSELEIFWPTRINQILRWQFLMIFLVRLAGVIGARSEFVPDEGWQSYEVARWIVYGPESGHLTWEWIAGIRSFLYPLIFVPSTCVLRALELDNPNFLVFIPRVFQALLCALGECCFVRYFHRRYSHDSTMMLVYLLLTNWFIFFCGSRTLTNNTEMAFALIGLELLDFGLIDYFVICAGISFFIRPTSVVFWLPLMPNTLKILLRTKRLRSTIVCGVVVLLANTICDFVFYGRLTLPWLNFLQFNVIEGQSAQFGTEPFFWYFYSALPSMLGVSIVLIYWTIFVIAPRYREFNRIIVIYSLVFSVIGHKEIRFLIPILPLCIGIVADLSCLIMEELNRKGLKKLFRLFNFVFYLNVIVSLGAAVLFTQFHQVGLKPATNFVHIESKNLVKPGIWVVMPCFSFPVHTYISNPEAQIEFFTCSPPKMEFDSPNMQTGDFSKLNLTDFVGKKLRGRGKAPDFVIVYDQSSRTVLNALRRHKKSTKLKYKIGFDAYHTIFPFDNVGERVQVLIPSRRPKIRPLSFVHDDDFD